MARSLHTLKKERQMNDGLIIWWSKLTLYVFFADGHLLQQLRDFANCTVHAWCLTWTRSAYTCALAYISDQSSSLPTR